jgi:hypothetical protein
MNKMEKYLDAIEAAVDANDQVAITLLDGFATHIYKDLYAKAGRSTGEERVVLDGLCHRAKHLIARMAKAGLALW